MILQKKDSEKLNELNDDQSKKQNLDQIHKPETLRDRANEYFKGSHNKLDLPNDKNNNQIENNNSGDSKPTENKSIKIENRSEQGSFYQENNYFIPREVSGEFLNRALSENPSSKKISNDNGGSKIPEIVDYLSNYNLSNQEIDALISKKNLNDYATHLLNSQLLILESPFEKASILIIDGILKDKQFKGFNIKSFDKTKFLSELEGDQFQFITRSVVTFDRPTILLIDISIDEYTKIMEDNFISYEQTKERLKKRKLYIIINYRQGNNHVIDTLEKPEFYFQVPFLSFFSCTQI